MSLSFLHHLTTHAALAQIVREVDDILTSDVALSEAPHTYDAARVLEKIAQDHDHHEARGSMAVTVFPPRTPRAHKYGAVDQSTHDAS